VTLRQALAEATRRLAAAGVPSPADEARYLLAALLELDRGQLLAHGERELDKRHAARFAAWTARRAGREPAQHITGVQEFHGRSFGVDRRALVPRPETELLVDAVLALALGPGARVIDVGTGSGCIAVTLAVERPEWTIVALERSAEALELARANARRHRVERRIEWVHADFRRAPADWCGRVAAVVSNPPYVSESEWAALEPEVRDHDPREALVAGPTGLEALRALAPLASRWLVPGGRFVVEIGFGQECGARAVVEGGGLEVLEVLPDLRRIPRVLLAAAGRR
jgi:release factor glutamine methyltransferase